MKKGIKSVGVVALISLAGSGCLDKKQYFEKQVAKPKESSTATVPESRLGEISPPAPNTSIPVNNRPVNASSSPSGLLRESFSIATVGTKKIDFLFVVDNSQSMADNQAKLASGFESFARSFFKRADLDICVAIITSDRYLGRLGERGYERERLVRCTDPQSRKQFSQAENEYFLAGLISEFKTKVKVGAKGSGAELMGKSLVTFLRNKNTWEEAEIAGRKNTFFRKDAVANITFLTDENNWNVGPEVVESQNDLPAVSSAQDARKGIVNYLNEYFEELNPGKGLSYSVSVISELSLGTEGIPSRAANLDSMDKLVGRETAKADIQDEAQVYTQLYESISESLVKRAAAFHLSRAFNEPEYPARVQNFRAVLVSPSNSISRELVLGAEYELLAPNGVVLKDRVSSATLPGDRLEIEYLAL